jgi:hypothetical protein
MVGKDAREKFGRLRNPPDGKLLETETELKSVRACDEISGALCCRPPGLLARRERRAYRVVCKERTTQPAGLRAAVRRGAAAGGHLLRCRSSTMSPHRLRGGALHLPARRSRQSVSLISSQALSCGSRVDCRYFGKGKRALQSAGAVHLWRTRKKARENRPHRHCRGG